MSKMQHKFPDYGIKQSDGEAPGSELWGMWTIDSLPLLLGPLWLEVVEPIRVPCMGRIELFNHLTVCKQMADIELNC